MKVSSRFILMALIVLGVAALAAVVGVWYGQRLLHNTLADGTVPSASSSRQVLYWYDPMVPQHKFDQPGKSPFMDMDLVPKYADDGSDATTVQIDPAIAHNLGVRTVLVSEVIPTRTVDAVGTLAFNTRDIAVVQTRTAGFVEGAYSRAVGDVVAAGAPLVDVLVPAWAGAQQEFLALQKLGEASLLKAARQRLRLLGMPESLIDEVARTEKTQAVLRITAPIGGAIQSIEARAGMTLNAGETVAQIVSLDSVWLDVAVPETAAAWLAPSSHADITFPAFPGERFSGKVLDVLPEAQQDTRTLTVRLALPNPKRRLKPGMFASVRLSTVSSAPAATPMLAVPSEAIIRTGQRTWLMLAETGGRYRPAEVMTGDEVGDQTLIVEGVHAGESVVVSGQFMIDSEASMKGVLARQAATSNTVPREPLHEADGVIIEIDGDNILLQHGPFPTLHMGAMTMLFPVETPSLLNGLKDGDAVRVGVRANDQGMVIARIDKRGKTAGETTP